MSSPIQGFCERFAHDVGLRDWSAPNARHEQLRKRLVLAGNPGARFVRRLRPALRLTRARGRRAGITFLLGRVPVGRPDEYRRDQR